MTAAVPSFPPFEDRSWRPPSRDFFGGPPPVDMTDPANVPPVQSEHEFLYGDVLPPEFVFTAGGAIAAPPQARRYARLAETFSPLIEKAVGPGAAAHFESEVRAISHNAIVVLDAVERLDALTDADTEVAHIEADAVLLEFVPDEVKSAFIRARERAGFWYS